MKLQFPFLPIAAGAVLGLAMQECPACAQTQNCSVLAKAALSLALECEKRPAQPVPVFGTGTLNVLGSPVPSLDRMDMAEKWQMQAAGHCEGTVAKKCHPHLVQDALSWMFPLLLKAVSVCDSGCSSLCCPAHQPFHLHSQ